jgi:hypothetical protein
LPGQERYKNINGMIVLYKKAIPNPVTEMGWILCFLLTYYDFLVISSSGMGSDNFIPSPVGIATKKILLCSGEGQG